jgi:dihydroxyacetone kinase-like predicted kinase
MLPELRAAGVVDAGGRGMVLLFDALSSVLSGTDLAEDVGSLGPVGHAKETAPEPLEHRYEVMFLWEGTEEELADLSRMLSQLGTSVVIVGGSGLYKAHVHTNAPEDAVAAGRDAARDVVVVDLRSEVADRCVAGQARGVRLAEQQATALVAVAEGEGLHDIFRSLGALVVTGGPGRNPSVGELADAAAEAPSDSVLILPNHPNVAAAAERAAAECEKDVRVVPTRSVVAGLSAAAAFNPTAPAEENESVMREAAEACVDIELTRAARASVTPTGRVRPGDWLGMVDAEIVAAGTVPEEIAAKLVAAHRLPDHELLTVIVGADASKENADAMETALEEAGSGLEIQRHRGGQPHYPYLIGLE